MNVADGTAITSLRRRHRTVELKKFLIKIDGQVPEDLDLHLICDDYGTHEPPTIKAWLEKHRRDAVHLTGLRRQDPFGRPDAIICSTGAGLGNAMMET